MKLLKLIANIGYGSRKEVTALFRDGRITDVDGSELSIDDAVDPQRVRIDGAPLDPSPGFILMLHSLLANVPDTRCGLTRLRSGPAALSLRSPMLATVGRLDRDTHATAADDRRLVPCASDRFATARTGEVYDANLARDLRGNDVPFSRAAMMLESEREPRAPAVLGSPGPRRLGSGHLKGSITGAPHVCRGGQSRRSCYIAAASAG